ncbi:class A beta-lactamase [Acuticoccus kandeliae]|uniref:class A beta-lactamase n=1 Tax=Acuticoccus kandeliae TaxID=2073160 RepID=UPI000D3E1605|nr:class A beta-lactamase [Acuticoccus kandeliae]
MRRDLFTLPRAAGLALCVLLPAPAFSADPETRLADTIARIESGLDARVGVLVRDSATDWEWGHRSDERFLMASTFKSVLCGAVLARVDAGDLSLSEPLAVRKAAMIAHAPVTEKHVGGTMSIGELCFATLDMSDNPAANILVERLGGTGAVTAFARALGDPVTRLDRLEPELNLFEPGDLRDTTSPEAMLFIWEAMLRGDALSPASRAQLDAWMSEGGVTGKLLRASTPDDWAVADKSGAGRDHTRNLVAMVTPPGRDPYFVAIYLSDSPADFAARNAAVAQIGKAVVDVIAAR